MHSVESLICTELQDEGIGSVYERVILSRWFRDLALRHAFESVLEYSCPITKGYDNLTFVDLGMPVHVADHDIELVRQGWKFTERPNFSTLEAAPRADLVWNFAQAQVDESIIDAMKPLSKQHVLLFVPNILNPGTPIHFILHRVSRTQCEHAERGSKRVRTRIGLQRQMADRGIEVLESGYIDAPPIPDIAFSIREFKEAMGWSRSNGHDGHPRSDPAKLWQRVQSMTGFETSPILAPMKPLLGHHIYVLGRVI